MIDCSPVFPKWERATATILSGGELATVTLHTGVQKMSVTIEINKLANFLDQLRREQARNAGL